MFTKWDVVMFLIAVFPIALVLMYTFADIQQYWVQYLERCIKAGPVLASGAVAFMFWQWYRNSLKEQIRYCHENVNKPIYVALYGTIRKPQLSSGSIVVREYSIKDRIRSYSTVTGNLYVDKVAKNKEELEKSLHWNRVQDKNLRLIRQARNILSMYRSLYPNSLLKDLDELPHKIKEYDDSSHSLNFQIFQKLRKYGIPEDWLDAAFTYVRGQLKLEPKTTLQEHVDDANRVVKEVKSYANDYKKNRDNVFTFLNSLKTKFDNYLIALGLGVPETTEENFGMVKEI